MAAPDLRQRYGNRTHGQDVLMGHASHGRHSVPALAAAVVCVRDWFDAAAGAAWRAAQSAAGWFSGGGGSWYTETTSANWHDGVSGSGWYDEHEDCS